MKKLAVIFSLFGVMAVFGFGFSNQDTLSNRQVEQIHLSCWDEQGLTSFGRVRLVLNSSLHGLAWFSDFAGKATDEGTIAPTEKAFAGGAAGITLHILSQSQDFLAQVPNSVFQPHVRSVRVTVEENQQTSSIECRKINLQKRQAAL